MPFSYRSVALPSQPGAGCSSFVLAPDLACFPPVYHFLSSLGPFCQPAPSVYHSVHVAVVVVLDYMYKDCKAVRRMEYVVRVRVLRICTSYIQCTTTTAHTSYMYTNLPYMVVPSPTFCPSPNSPRSFWSTLFILQAYVHICPAVSAWIGSHSSWPQTKHGRSPCPSENGHMAPVSFVF